MDIVKNEAAPIESPRRLLRDLRSPPNALSLSRVALTWAGALFFLSGMKVAGVALGVLAGLTDTLDGILARRLGLQSRLGAVLDLFSDLNFESLCLLLGILYGALPVIYFPLYLAREFMVVSIRLFSAQMGASISSSILGKLKSNFLGYSFLPLFLGIGELLPWPSANAACRTIAFLGITVGLILSGWSGAQYFLAFKRVYERNHERIHPPV